MWEFASNHPIAMTLMVLFVCLTVDSVGRALAGRRSR